MGMCWDKGSGCQRGKGWLESNSERHAAPPSQREHQQHVGSLLFQKSLKDTGYLNQESIFDNKKKIQTNGPILVLSIVYAVSKVISSSFLLAEKQWQDALSCVHLKQLGLFMKSNKSNKKLQLMCNSAAGLLTRRTNRAHDFCIRDTALAFHMCRILLMVYKCLFAPAPTPILYRCPRVSITFLKYCP